MEENKCTGCFDPNCGSDKPLAARKNNKRNGRLVDVKVILMSYLKGDDTGDRVYQTIEEYTVTYHEKHIPRRGAVIWIGDESRYEVSSIASGIYPNKDNPGLADGYLEIIATRDEA